VTHAERLRNEDVLAKLAADRPAARLVDIWNSLLGEPPVKKFEDRATAVSRIWKAMRSLGQNVPVAEEPAPDRETASVDELPETALVRNQEAGEAAQPEVAITGSTEPAPATFVAPQTPDVAPKKPAAKKRPRERSASRRD